MSMKRGSGVRLATSKMEGSPAISSSYAMQGLVGGQISQS